MIRLFWSVLESALYPLIMVVAMWVVFLFNINYQWNLEEWGLKPHDVLGLIGIVLMPFLHENFEHLFSNTIPLLVAGSFLFHYFQKWTWLIIAVVWILGGIFLWFIGEEGTNHIGASGLVYGLVFFLLVSGIIRGHRNLAAVALLMVFLYGSLVWGIFPDYVKLMQENISWEGHLGGAIMGSLMAIILMQKGPSKPLDSLSMLKDDEETDEYPYWLEGDIPTEMDESSINELENKPQINYRYVPKNANPWEKDD